MTEEFRAGKAVSALNGNPVTCGARTRAGGACCQPAMRNGRCRQHGGMSLRGLSHPNTKHGRRSKYLPHGLIAEVEDRMGRPWTGVGALPHAGATNSAVGPPVTPSDSASMALRASDGQAGSEGLG